MNGIENLLIRVPVYVLHINWYNANDELKQSERHVTTTMSCDKLFCTLRCYLIYIYIYIYIYKERIEKSISARTSERMPSVTATECGCGPHYSLGAKLNLVV